jgi:hypothetical protein
MFHVSFLSSILFIKTRPPDKLHNGFGFFIQFRVGIPILSSSNSAGWFLHCLLLRPCLVLIMAPTSHPFVVLLLRRPLVV